jgi:hypothetical protein
MPTRSGACNHCGQCCGAEGSPYQKNPWPSTWPEALRTRSDESLPGVVKWLGDRYHHGKDSGKVRINGVWYYYIWITGVGLCKDLEPHGDPGTYSVECPFLMDDPGDGSHPCAIAGTNWEEYCNQENMPEEVSDEFVDKWTTRHPACGYTWS